MAQDEYIDVPKGTWVLITDEDVSGDCTVSVMTGKVLVKALADTTLPTTATGPRLYEDQGWNQVTLVELFPKASAVRLAAYAEDTNAVVYICHNG